MKLKDLFRHKHTWRWETPEMPGYRVVGTVSRCACGAVNPQYVIATRVDEDQRIVFVTVSVREG